MPLRYPLQVRPHPLYVHILHVTFTCAKSKFLIFSLLGPAGLTVDDHDPLEDKVYIIIYYIYITS